MKKNNIFKLLIAFVFALILSTNVYAAEIKGDLDGDGEVTAYDAYLSLLIVQEEDAIEVTEENVELIDIDSDKEVTEEDTQLILDYSVDIVEDPTMWVIEDETEAIDESINRFYYNQLDQYNMETAKKYYTEDEVLDKFIGAVGTPKRDDFEARLQQELRDYEIGEAIRQTRKKQGLTQEQLGERIGVKKAQISRIESGKSITYDTLRRVFQALGSKSAWLDLGELGRVALWLYYLCLKWHLLNEDVVHITSFSTNR